MRKLFLIMMTLIACTWSLSAQTRTYHGTILDAANNEPLIGATVMPIGGGQGVAADIDGKFTLTVPAKVTTAKVSYVGYTPQTVDLSDGMTIHLQSASTSLDEMVVVAYGTATKESLTGSVAVVGAKDIEDRPVTSVTAALEGNAPGVRVNNSVGYPGSAPEIRIRGFNSINGSNAPLYVVDGVPYDGSIADLNPQDIESMSVLKDAASSALYGNKGANGVILITTKRAKNSGHVEVNLSVREGMYNRGLPFYDRLNANEYMQTLFDALVNGRISKAGVTRDDAIAYYRRGTNFMANAKYNVYGNMPAADMFNEDGLFVAGNPLPGYTDLDWWPAISQNGFRQEYNINAAAATDKFNVFASVGYLKENGYVLQTDFERYSGRINAEFQPVSFFRTGVNLNATYSDASFDITSKSDESLINNPFRAMKIAPIFPYYAHDSDTGEILYDEYGSPLWNTGKYLPNNGVNVAYSMRLDKNHSSAAVIDASLYGTAIIPYGFELTVRGNIHRDKTTGMGYTNNVMGSGSTYNGYIAESWGTYKNHTFMQTLTWTHDYGDNHLDVLLDHENYEYSQDTSSLAMMNQLFPDRFYLSNFADYYTASESMLSLRTESYLGRVRYNYDQKYFAEASLRRDGSSYFEKDKRWGTFWSVGGSWIISKEKFMQNLNWMNYLKLRAAYGSVGNDASAGAYSYLALYELIKYGNEGSLIPVSLASNNLKWEATRTFDIALEGSLFNDRFNFSVGYFNKRNTDLIFSVTQPLSGGTIADSGGNPSILQNIGTMQNIGWELSFGVDIIRTRDFQWNFNVDATFLKNKIIKLPKNQDQPGNGLFMGKSIYEMYNTYWAGVDVVTGQSLYEIDPNSPSLYNYNANGEKIFNETTLITNLNNAAEQDALYVIDGKYYTTSPAYSTPKLLGSALPTVDGSFSTNLSWKGINIGMLFTYSLGGKVYDSVYAELMNVGTEPNAVHKDIFKSWTEAPAGSQPHEIEYVTYTGTDGTSYQFPAYKLSSSEVDPNGVPQLNTDNTANNNWGSSRWLTSGDYLVFKNLNVSYDLPHKWVDAMKLQNINLGFSVDNLFTVTKRKGMNPQYGWSGGQGYYYVPARVFSFQLNVKF